MLLLAIAGLALAAEPVFGERQVLHFENGLDVVLQAVPEASSVGVVTTMSSGWDTDPEGARGTAHLAEHLWFRVSDGTGDNKDAYEAHGCRTKAFTEADQMQFQAQCPADAAQWAVSRELARFDDPLVDLTDTVVAVESAVVAQERRERLDAFEGEVQRALLARLRPEGDPMLVQLDEYGRLDPVTREGLQTWARQNWTPGASAMAVVGDIDPAALIAQLTERFGAPVAESQREALHAQRSDDALLAPQDRTWGSIESRSTKPRLLLGWNLPGEDAAGLVQDELASHVERSLRRALDERDEVLEVGCWAFEGPALGCALTLAPGSGRDLRPEIDEAIVRATSGKGVAELKEELRTALSRLPQEVVEDLTHPLDRAVYLSQELLELRRSGGVDALLAALRGWKPQRAVATLVRAMDPADTVGVWVGTDAPEPEAPALEPVPSAVAAGWLPEASGQPVPTIVPTGSVRLDNGMFVMAVQRPHFTTTQVTLRFAGGTDAGPPGLAAASEALSFSPWMWESEQIGVSESVGRSWVQVHAVGPAKLGRQVLDTARRASAERYPMIAGEGEKWLERWVEARRLELEEETRPAHVARRTLLARQLPGTTAGLGLSAEHLDQLAHLSPEAVFAYLWRVYQPGNAVAVVSGPQSPGELLDWAGRTLGKWEPVEGMLEEPYGQEPLRREAEALEVAVDDPDLASSEVALRCRVARDTAELTGRLFEGVLERRLWRELRTSTGALYTPMSGRFTLGVGASVYWLELASAPGRGAQVLSQAKDLIADPITAAELDWQRRRLQRELALDADAPGGLGSWLFLVHREGGDERQPLSWVAQQLEGTALDQVEAVRAACVEHGAWALLSPPGTGPHPSPAVDPWGAP